ncbi:MAG: class I SAM-dependent methyltransferase [Pseudomonadota bacterium]
MPDIDLDRAYGLKTTQEAQELYADWAQTYDQDFGAAYGYVAPREIAKLYLAKGGTGPCLDVGAGTGLLAAYLGGITVDAIDLSPEMLEIAREKGLYRHLIQGDLLAPLEMPDDVYAGAVSSGTFTYGHVGPECLAELLRVVRPGGLFVCSCVPKVFDGLGFGSALARLQASGQISPLRFADIAIYENAEHEHAEDRVLAMIFRKSI